MTDVYLDDASSSGSRPHDKLRYEQINNLFLDALKLPPKEREQWVRSRSDCEDAVVDRVLSMLRADDESPERSPGELSNEDNRLAATTAPDTPANFARLEERILPHLDNYELLGEIARGGMGVVYKARQLRPNRIVAIKMIRAGRFASENEVERFINEAEAAAQVDDEAVVPVYELGEIHGEPFIAMKYVEGESLESLLERNAISTTDCVKALIEVCRAVARANHRGVIHRDLKPSNILIEQATGRPSITDFGLAKYLSRDSSLTAVGDVLGTPGYMAPEQAFGDSHSASPATDVYGLGSILYRLLTGKPPIQSDNTNLADAIRLIREHNVISPRTFDRRIPRALTTICMKCLEKDAKRRYRNASDLADDLQCFLEGEPIQAKPLGWARRLHRWARHRPGLSVTWCALAVFYSYHLVCRLFGLDRDLIFAKAAISITIAVAINAWFWQRLLIRTKGSAWVLYAWATMDVALLTLLLFAGDSANSGLVLLYHVMVAGSVLRCRTDLIGYVAFLAMGGYGTHVLYLQWIDPPNNPAPPLLIVLPTLLSLAVIGIIQYFALRRSNASFESRAATPLG